MQNIARCLSPAICWFWTENEVADYCPEKSFLVSSSEEKMLANFKKLAMAFFVACLFSGCEENRERLLEEQSEPKYNIGLYTEKPVREAYLKTLSDVGISFEIVDDRMLFVPTKNLAEALGAKRKFHNQYFYGLDGPSASATESIFIQDINGASEKKKNKYLEALRVAGVKVTKIEERTKTHTLVSSHWEIQYEQMDGPLVDQIRQRIELSGNSGNSGTGMK